MRQHVEAQGQERWTQPVNPPLEHFYLFGIAELVRPWARDLSSPDELTREPSRFTKDLIVPALTARSPGSYYAQRKLHDRQDLQAERNLDMANMDAQQIVNADRMNDGIIIRFDNGKCAFYSCAFLYEKLSECEELNEGLDLLW